MKVVVIGAGLIGLTTAWALLRRGLDVVVIERAREVGTGASFANGAMLTPSMSQPWNEPGCWKLLLKSLAVSDQHSALKLTLRAFPAIVPWGWRFLANSTPSCFRRNTAANLALALYSMASLEEVRAEARLDYWHRPTGTVRIFRTASAWQDAYIAAQEAYSGRVRLERISTAGVLEKEPALAPVATEIAGGIFYADDEVGDAKEFCDALAGWLLASGATILNDATVTRLQSNKGRIAAVHTTHGEIGADIFVLAAGAWSPRLLQNIEVKLPIEPVKGFSITYQDCTEPDWPKIPVVDDGLHAGVVPLKGACRLVGTAEFSGFDMRLSKDRLSSLADLLRRVLPNAANLGKHSKSWCGLRPMAADGVPIIGETKYPNLYINSGHGHLGWTMAAGSACLAADLICSAPTEIDRRPYSLDRFS
jgi:D-amino-acid dehydrogenase